MEGVWSVGEAIRYLRDILDEDALLAGLWIEGEVSNLSHSSAGHTYFTLKDGECQLRCVQFRGQGRARNGALAHGALVIVHGRMSVYEAQGSVQLYVDAIQSAGIGDLHRRFEELRERLRDEGLFDEERKRPLPAMPRRIGIVTSAQAAAFADICRVLAARYPVAEIVLAPTLVQGAEAPAQIVTALGRLATLGALDVIIVARGGGSLEDLWAFNDEAVARAIVACPIPVVTGIGHETDTTIADLAADLRAPTPTAAAMAVTPDRQELLMQIAALHDDLRRALDDRLRQEQATLAARARELAYLHPARRIAQTRQHVDELDTVLRERALHHIDLHRERLFSRRAALALLDPRETLDRGFALLLDTDGRIVRGAAGIAPGATLRVRLRDGIIPVTVTGAVKPVQGA